ncbi:helix-turn-helix domain-containing protein [Sphingobium yanoikuyae]|uniref:helix-turn-helix domain-containing protein n=1 Tax=Sphingobium yanoikuyae TaxID=13690 RepID=UPI0009B9249E
MSNTPYTLACQSQGRVQHGSILSGNLRPTRVTSQWKSTAKGVSQERFAQLANVERARYGRIERGELNISVNVLFALAAGLGVKPSEILGEIELTDCQPDSVDLEAEDTRA